MNTVKRYFLRILPLSLGVMMWAVGYAFKFYDPIAFSICDDFYGKYCLDAVGLPLLAYSQWLMVAGIVLLFARYATLKRWAVFALFYLAITAVVLAYTGMSTGGIGFNERLFMSHVFGVLFLVVTILWVIVHTIILRRRERRI